MAENDRRHLIEYVGTASDLAESLQGDIRSGKRTYSNETIVKLSKFVAAAERFRHILDLIDQVQTNEKGKLQ